MLECDTPRSGYTCNDRGNPNSVIDMDHAPGKWTSSPTSDFDTCDSQAWMTINLGSPHSMSGATIWHYYGNNRAYCSQKVAISATGEFAGEETVVMDTGTCSGWCSFPITCTNGEAGDCTPDNYGPTEAAEGNAFTWEPVVGQFLRHWSGRGQNSGVHFMEIDVYGCEGTRTMAGGDTGMLGLSAWTPDMTMPRVDPGGWELKDIAYTAPRNTIALDGDLADWDCNP